ncbi:MAG: hypothetical protein GXP52_02845 [Deltaproteobacteria bacterium]|nr:hypothetical protein [Deltaproteobacteria bacterium]
MSRVVRWLAPAVLLTVLAGTVLWSGADTLRDPHTALSDHRQCDLCHEVGEDGTVLPDRLKGPIIDQCYSCHPPGKMGRSHPVNVDLRRNRMFPDMEVPEVLLVGWDWDDVLTCVTCHTVHEDWKSVTKCFPGQEPLNMGGNPLYYRTYYLRISGDPKLGWAPLCDACHKLL